MNPGTRRSSGPQQGDVAGSARTGRLRRLLCYWYRQPIYRILLLTMLVVALVPVVIIANHLYESAWRNAWREVQEKHRLLAMNLASPIHIYIQSHKDMLAELAAGVARQTRWQRPDTDIRGGLQNAFAHLDGFRMLALLTPSGKVRVLVHRDQRLHTADFSDESCFRKTRDTARWALSNLKPSPVTGEPTFLMSQPVLSRDKRLLGVLIGELRIELIESLRRNVHFGERGHSAIVDRTGRVIAHPNPAWMAERRDLSSWPIVQAMMAGGTGVMEFYSPFINADMVAGYAAVPDFGWGIMVPQPKSEVAAQVSRLLRIYLLWAGGGLLLALLLAIPLVRWITRPMNRLAEAADDLLQNNLEGNLPASAGLAPMEVTKLHETLYALVRDIQESRREVNHLNTSLQAKVTDATQKLLESNQRLEQLALCDHLTALPNRRFFEETLDSALHRRQTDKQDLCLMLIDIDEFKSINDTHGHAGGDMVIQKVAEILNSVMRSSDLVARYGGDEFIAQLHCDFDTGMEKANRLRQRIEQYPFVWQDRPIPVTVSIGVLHYGPDQAGGMSHLLEAVDRAMYTAKRQGRNQVAGIAQP